ncbi:MAG TPA: DUF4097 family beta strand repeat-containing protein [Opitutaceae bacterium]|nr:DUF4097 family beta strand repeat-containing protein [Opitutaceae bacterium]
MKSLINLAFSTVLLIAPLSARAVIERTVSDSFPVQAGGTLKVETFSGGIHVQSAAGSTVKVEIREKIDASSEAEADELLKKLALSRESHGVDVSIVAKYDGENHGFHMSWGHWWPPVQLEITVTVPENYNVDLATSGGGISVGDLRGLILTRTSGGALKFGKITGEIKGKTSGGGIFLESCSGKADLNTSGGSIRVGTLSGPAQLHTSGGGIAIKSAVGPLSAHTSGGSIDVGFSGPLTGDCDLVTSGGGIRVEIDAKSNFNLDAKTSAGSVKCSLPITMDHADGERSRIEGKVGTGGPLLKLRSSAGSIHVTST